MAKAILIDPKNQEIREINIQSWRDIRSALGCDFFATGARLADGSTLFIDDEGFLKPQENNGFFCYRSGQPLAGRGVFVGPELSEWDGHYGDPPSLESIQKDIRFMTYAQVCALLSGKPNSTMKVGDEPETVISWWDDILPLSRPKD